MNPISEPNNSYRVMQTMYTVHNM